MSISKLITSSSSIALLGRGPSLRYFNKKKKILSISINFDKIGEFAPKIRFETDKLCLVSKDSKVSIKNFFNYKIGSVQFGLLNVLAYLNSFKLRKNIFLYGFDFRKFSEDEDIFKKTRIKNDLNGLQQIIDINTQKNIYSIIKNKFKYLKIIKVGFDFDSDFDKKKYLKIDRNFEIISEFTTNHQGSTDRLIKLLDLSIKANCKVIKFQRRDVENFYQKKILLKKYLTPISKNFLEYRKNLELTKDQIEIIKYYQKRYDLKVIFSALDIKSYLYLKKEGFKYFKIPSTISVHKNFIKFVANQNTPLTYISTGMTNEKYLQFILNLFKKKKIVLMHAISSYPASFQDLNLDILRKYVDVSKKNKNIIPGYSSHDIGNLGSILAVAIGAKVIEKHIKIGITDWMHYDDTALDAEFELPKFIEDLKKTRISLGSDRKKVYDFEHHKYTYVK